MKISKYIIIIFIALTLFFVAKGVNAATIQRAPNNLGLVGYWSFNEGTSTKATDFSGHGNAGTLSTTGSTLPQWTGGKLGMALSFDGSTNNVTLSGPTVSDTLTFTAWFKVTSYPDAWGTLIAQNNTLGIFVTNDNKISYYYGTADHKNTNSFNQGQWNHVAVVNEGGNAIFYINGVADGGCGSAPGFTVGYIGKDNNNNDDFNGLIDEVRVYNRALSASEIKQLYNLGAARVKPDMPQTNLMKDSSLVGFWSFNGPDISNTANLAYDRSGQGNNGTMTNMATSTRYAIGKSGQALRFDGVDDYFETDLANNLMDSYQTGAVSAWVKTSVSGTGDFLAYANSTDVNSANSEWEVSNGVPAFEFQCSGWGRTYGSITVNDNKWHHIVFSADGTNPVKIYVDGVLDSTNYSGACGNNTYWVADILNIGSYNNYIDIGTLRRSTGLNDQFPGLIDEVRIYNRTLSAAEVMQLYRASGGR